MTDNSKQSCDGSSNQYLSDSTRRLSVFYDAIKDKLTMAEQNELWSLVGNFSRMSVDRSSAVETSPKPARDADHCDFPDCEKHWSAFARMLSGLLVECRPYVVKADVGQQAHPHLLLHKIDVAVKNSPLEPNGDELETQIYALLVRRGYAQHEADAIAKGPGCTHNCVQNGYRDIDCPAHGKRAEPAEPLKPQVRKACLPCIDGVKVVKFHIDERGARRCLDDEPWRDMTTQEQAALDKALAAHMAPLSSSLIVTPEEAKRPLAFRHWSKDPLIPYANCHCDTCSRENGSRDDA